jgi:hypothetical protein
MIAHVRLVAVLGDESSLVPADLPPEAASYLEVRGILIERIDGYI